MQNKSFLSLLNPSNNLVINTQLMHVIGLQETVMFQNLIQKQNYYDKLNKLSEDGFFYATSKDIERSTTLTQRQQSTIINKLTELKLIEVVNRGVPCKKHFKVIASYDTLEFILTNVNQISETSDFTLSEQEQLSLDNFWSKL